MSIAKKTAILVVCTIAAIMTVVYVVTHYVYMNGFDDLERKNTEQSVHRATDAIAIKLHTLDVFCHDWAEWDDTYYFAKEGNQVYADRNFTNDTFITEDLSIFMILDTRGELVYGKAFDQIYGQEIALPAGLTGLISDVLLEKSRRAEKAIEGITILSGQPVLISSRPIFTSLGEGPSTGSLIVGRYIDSSLTSYIADTTSSSVQVLLTKRAEQNPELNGIIESLKIPDSVYIGEKNSNSISGYALFSDFSQNPVFLIKVSVLRDIHSQAIRTVFYLHGSQLLIAIVFGFIFIFLFRYMVLSRLSTLSNAVNAIGSKGDISSRVTIGGKDELTRLADNINNMLYSLEKSEARRESQKEVIGHIITNTPNGVLAFNDAGSIAMVNESFRAMFDLKNEKLMGNKIADVPGLSEIAQEIKEFKESRSISLRKELQFKRNGLMRNYIASFARLKEEKLYILYMTDITDERSKQESLYLTDRLASIGEMASGIAHELNNPLTSIIGLSEIVMREEVPEDVKEDLGLIKNESHRAAGIVRNLLSFARKNATLKQQGHVNKIIMDVLKLRSYEHGVNNIKAILEMDPDLPEIMIDNNQIQQVFINIILNAEHAMVTTHGKGTLRVKTELAEEMVRISFTDDGPGIEPQNLRRIFDPFFTTKEVGKGTGLGLSISYGIVNAHNGNIYATSEFGKGATFIVELPIHDNVPREAN